MQSALRFVEPRPASGARIFSRPHTSRAMGASNAGIAAIVQRIVGQVVVMDVTPDFCGGPIDERVDLDQMKLRVPLHFESAGARRGLIATDAGHPRAQPRELVP